jgi:chemotaxis protein MotB
MALIKEEDCPEGLPGWLATFGDLMSLLLTFFVLLLSFSSTEEVKFNKAMGALKGSLGVFESEPEMTQPIRINIPLVRGNIKQSQNIRSSAENLEKTLSDEGHEGDVSLTGTSTGLVINIQAPVLYDVGGAELKPEIRQVLLGLGQLLSQLPNQIVVQGHSDNVPMSNPNGRYPSNWELSYQRAVSVVRFLITDAFVLPTRMAAEGYGEYRPIAPNDTPEGRAKNRRVEIHILYAGEKDGNLQIISDVFKDSGIDASRKDGSAVVKPRTRRSHQQQQQQQQQQQ